MHIAILLCCLRVFLLMCVCVCVGVFRDSTARAHTCSRLFERWCHCWRSQEWFRWVILACTQCNTITINNNNAHYTLHITHYTLHITQYTLHITHYTIHITHYTIHITHYTHQVITWLEKAARAGNERAQVLLIFCCYCCFTIKNTERKKAKKKKKKKWMLASFEKRRSFKYIYIYERKERSKSIPRTLWQRWRWYWNAPPHLSYGLYMMCPAA